MASQVIRHGRAVRSVLLCGLSVLMLAAAPGSSLAATDLAKINESRATAIVLNLKDVARERKANPGSHTDAELQGDRWRIQLWTKSGSLVAEVFVSGRDGRVLEKYLGYHAAWGMARGTPGAFGRDVSALWVWLPLTALFLAPFIPRRRPGLAHADIAAIAALSVSIAFFNHGRISLSTPLMYPPMLWLLGRLLWRGFRGPSSRPPHTPLLSRRVMLLGTVFLIGFRIAFTAADGNVIDVGDASVVGGTLLADGKPLYGHFPQRIDRGDTYGPVTYEAYAPFAFVLDGTTENHNAVPAKVAAITFDLLALLLLTLVGWRYRGPPLAALAAWFWVTCPFTLYVAMCAANDALPAALLALALLAATLSGKRGGAARGAAVALMALSKMVGVLLIPLFLRVKRSGGAAVWVLYAAVLVATSAVVMIPFHGDPLSVVHRTLGYQTGRDAPFSAWGLYGLPHLARQVWVGCVIGLAALVAFVPRSAQSRTLPRVAALAGGVLIAAQLSAVYWFYTYIVWFLPAVAMAVLPDWVGKISAQAQEEGAAQSGSRLAAQLD